MTKLVASESLLRKIPGDEHLRSISTYLLLLAYFQQGEYERLLRYLEAPIESNNHVKNLLDDIYARECVNRRVASNVLLIKAM